MLFFCFITLFILTAKTKIIFAENNKPLNPVDYFSFVCRLFVHNETFRISTTSFSLKIQWYFFFGKQRRKIKNIQLRSPPLWPVFRGMKKGKWKFVFGEIVYRWICTRKALNSSLWRFTSYYLTSIDKSSQYYYIKYYFLYTFLSSIKLYFINLAQYNRFNMP